MEKDQNITEKHLQLLKAGNPRAFKQIFLCYEKRLYFFVFSITKSEYIAEEILQEVFIKIWTNRESIDINRSFESFIFTITRNLTYNYLRDASRREAIRNELWTNVVAQHQEVESNLIFEEYKEIVEDIIQNLPVQKRSIYQLSRQEGKSNSEIAAILGISPKTVRNHMWSTMSTIRTQLKPYIDDTLRLLAYVVVFLGSL